MESSEVGKCRITCVVAACWRKIKIKTFYDSTRWKCTEHPHSKGGECIVFASPSHSVFISLGLVWLTSFMADKRLLSEHLVFFFFCSFVWSALQWLFHIAPVPQSRALIGRSREEEEGDWTRTGAREGGRGTGGDMLIWWEDLATTLSTVFRANVQLTLPRFVLAEQMH